jgi:hypothetical protein
MEAISLGWNCESAMKGVSMGIRGIKVEGYNTCPFDECITNYEGVILCLKEDFKYFCDPSFLKIIPAPYSTGGIVKGEKLLYNTRYKFIFNHESPGHANLYIRQRWNGGINHYIDNNYALFIERYNRRINNFREYIKTKNITFIIGNFNPDTAELSNTIKIQYPELKFNILHYTPNCSKQIFDEHYELQMC